MCGVYLERSEIFKPNSKHRNTHTKKIGKNKMKKTILPILIAALSLVNLNSANAQIYINELYFNPAGTDAPNEFIELRGTPGLSVGAGNYLLFLEGDNGTVSTTPGGRAGDIQGMFNLSSTTFGSNGYMVLRQFSSPYTVNGNASTYTGTSTGWGGLGFNSATVAGDVENPSFTAMIVNIGSGSAPTWGSQLDANNDGTLELPTGWSILDSIGVGDNKTTARLYGAVNFSSAPDTSTVTTNGGLLKYLGWSEIEYLARVGTSTGNALLDWAVADVGFTAPGTVVDSIVNGPDTTSGVQESWNIASGVRILDTLGSANPVPEPSSAALLGLGMAALVAVRALRRNREDS